MRPIYLDHAATTSVDPRVREAMESFQSDRYGNPSSIHRLGQQARMAIDAARETIAGLIECEPSEIVFTSGGTESNNAAVRGTLCATGSDAHIVTTAIEHEAIIETVRNLEGFGDSHVSCVLPDSGGIVSCDAIERVLGTQTSLVSVMWANNEIGTIQPVPETAGMCRDRGITFHSDGVQALGSIAVSVKDTPVDLLSASAHKFYGPKGVGFLYIRSGTLWRPQQMGGGQERLRRSGTENVAGIVGMAKALELAVDSLASESARLCRLRDRLFEQLTSVFPAAVTNGDRAARLPGNVNISFPGLSGESLVMALDAEGVMASSGSACASGSTEPSHVLLALGRSEADAGSALRLTLGRENTTSEIDYAARLVINTASRLYEGRAAPVV